jgi:flagellar motor protein MotB
MLIKNDSTATGMLIKNDSTATGMLMDSIFIKESIIDSEIEFSKENLNNVLGELDNYESKMLAIKSDKVQNIIVKDDLINKKQILLREKKIKLDSITNEINKIQHAQYNPKEKIELISSLKYKMGSINKAIKIELAALINTIKAAVIVHEDSIQQYIKENTIKSKVELGKAYVYPEFFDFGSSTLNPQAYVVLNDLVTVLNSLPNPRVEMTAHADAFRDIEKTKRIFEAQGLSYSKEKHEKRSITYNQQLSQKRAQAIVNYLVSKGVNKEWLSAKGLGETKPITLNFYPDLKDNPKGRLLNRRVEFKILSLNTN